MHTADLPPTPVRDRVVVAADWAEAPPELLADAVYRRRIGRWLLWRAGDSRGDDTVYLAFDPDDLSRRFTFALAGDGVGPSGTRHTRFRTWKEDLRDSG